MSLHLDFQDFWQCFNFVADIERNVVQRTFWNILRDKVDLKDWVFAGGLFLNYRFFSGRW